MLVRLYNHEHQEDHNPAVGLIGDSDIEVAYKELSGRLWDNPEIDATLWVLGRVSKLRRSGWQELADQFWNQLYGGGETPAPTPVPSSGAGSFQFK